VRNIIHRKELQNGLLFRRNKRLVENYLQIILRAIGTLHYKD